MLDLESQPKEGRPTAQASLFDAMLLEQPTGCAATNSSKAHNDGVTDVETQTKNCVSPNGDDHSIDNDNTITNVVQRPLTKLEVWNLTFCLLAWACTISNITLVVGTSSAVLLSVGGSISMSSVPLGAYMMGSSLVSLLVTPWLFDRWGRQIGFNAGIGIGIAGSLVGVASIFVKSPGLLIISNMLFGAATGIGFYLRFAAIEIVPPHWASRAVTLVVSGGCVGAFAGPESSRGIKDIFGADLDYLGIFLLTGLFCCANLICIGLVQFPAPIRSNLIDDSDVQHSLEPWSIGSIIRNRHFWIPTTVLCLCWSIMAMPMSMVRVAMQEVGFSSLQSLRTIEIHFLGMYSPGFVTGPLIQLFGVKKVCYLAVIIFGMALTLAFISKDNDSGSAAPWMIGLFLVGVGWNCAFTASTIWLTGFYKNIPQFKNKIQAASEFTMFLIAGIFIVCSSYIYNAGDRYLSGWHKLNYVATGMVGVMVFVLLLEVFLNRKRTIVETTQG